eukprot:4768087-Prymnesium_polylepis.1
MRSDGRLAGASLGASAGSAPSSADMSVGVASLDRAPQSLPTLSDNHSAESGFTGGPLMAGAGATSA